MSKTLLSLTMPLLVLAFGFLAGRPEVSPEDAKPKPAVRERGSSPIESEVRIPDDCWLYSDGAELCRVDDFPQPLARFQTVFWDPRDTESLRSLIRTTALVEGKTVLEIGTGTGLLSLCCLQAGALRVVATDVNAAAIANARYNAAQLRLADRLETRLVPLDHSEAFTMVEASEQFDLIISNPPWENQNPGPIGEYALYDRDFALMASIIDGLVSHLKPGGKALLAYGCGEAIATLDRLADAARLSIRKLDERDPRTLPEVFLPGMLFEVSPRLDDLPRASQ